MLLLVTEIAGLESAEMDGRKEAGFEVKDARTMRKKAKGSGAYSMLPGDLMAELNPKWRGKEKIAMHEKVCTHTYTMRVTLACGFHQRVWS